MSMIKKFHLTLLAWIFNGFISLAHGDAAAPVVKLHLQNKQMILPAPVQQELSRQALQLLETSNFHSDPGDKYHFFTRSGVQNDYRKEVAGRFLRISFQTSRRIKTAGGEITVAEIVIGLNRPDYTSSLFTLDDTGRILEHSKYAGERCIELLKSIKQLTSYTEP